MPDPPAIAALLPESNACPENPRPKQACISISHDAFDTTKTNSQQTPELSQLQPSTPPFGRLALGAPPGLNTSDLIHLLPLVISIPPAATVCESQGHPTSDSISNNQPRYSTEIFYNQVLFPETVSDSSFTPDAVILGNTPSGVDELSNQALVAGKISVDHSPDSVDTSSLPMHKCFALASTRVVRFDALKKLFLMDYLVTYCTSYLVRQNTAM